MDSGSPVVFSNGRSGEGGEASSRPGLGQWLGPLRVPASMAVSVDDALTRLDRTSERGRWIPLSLVAGVLPLALCAVLGVSGGSHQVVSAALLLPFFLAATRMRREFVAMGMVVLAFVSHSALAIALAAWQPVLATGLLPGGAWYWSKNVVWIKTGVDPEFHLASWLPAQAQLLGAMVFFSYVSLGMVPLYEGFYEVDLMNFYNGRLLMCSQSPWLALALGWHAWSIARGVGYVLLTYEVTALSLGRLLGLSLSRGRACRWRWGLGLGFLVLDVILKIWLTEPVRAVLQANLLAQAP